MGFTRVITYPFVQIGRGLRRQVELNAQAKKLAYYYDIAARIGKVYNLPARINGHVTYQLFGRNLSVETEKRRVTLRGAALAGSAADIIASIEAAWPRGLTPPKLDKGVLAKTRVFAGASGRLGSIYDTFVPVKSARALDHLIATEHHAERSALAQAVRLSELQTHYEQLLGEAKQKISYLNLGHQAFLEIMSAIYQTNSDKTLMENTTRLFDVVTHWAYQVVGRSPDSEAAGWVVQTPDGKIGVPYRYLLAMEGQPLGESRSLTLCRAGSTRAMTLTLDENQTTVQVADSRGRFTAVEEWEDLSVREDLVIVEQADGSRRLFRRDLQPGSKMATYLAKGLVGDKAGEGLGKVVGVFAGALTEVVGKFRALENAYVELVEVPLSAVDLDQGMLIPIVQAGTVIKIVSAGSNKPNLREEKVAKGLKIEEACRKGGLEIGVINQRLDMAVGNIRMSALKPLALMISDVAQFHVRPQNRFLISIVGTESYFIRSLMEFNDRGEAVCLGALEVTNPEVIPAKLSPEEEERLIAQFEAGRLFASLASTGIMIKVLQEEMNEMTRSYLGAKVYRLVKERDFAKLRGQKIEGATIMFADVSGFTALSDVLKDAPAEIISLLTQLFSRLDPIVVQNEGMVDKHDGDCIMAGFGVPERTPGDTRGAVTAAIRLMQDLEEINEEMKTIYAAKGIKPLGLTVGLNTGTVIAGNLGHEGSKIEYSVIGDAVNVAARLQHAVVRGQVMIGETTYQALTPTERQRLAVDLGTTEEELFLPAVIHAKNKGAVPCYYLNWDGSRNRASSLAETKAMIEKDGDPERREQMRRTYRQLLGEG